MVDIEKGVSKSSDGGVGARKEKRSGVLTVAAWLAIKGVDLPKERSLTFSSLFGWGIPGVKSIFAGFPGLFFLGSVSVAFWVFFGKISGFVVYFIVFLVWCFIGRVLWLARDKMRSDRLRLLWRASAKDIDQGVREQVEEAALEAAKEAPRKVRRGQVVSVDRGLGIVRISFYVLDEIGEEKKSVQEFPTGFLSDNFLSVVRPGAYCRVEEFMVSVSGEHFGVTEIVPDVIDDIPDKSS